MGNQEVELLSHDSFKGQTSTRGKGVIQVKELLNMDNIINYT